MPQKLINLGSIASDGIYDSDRTLATKINANFAELFGNGRQSASPVKKAWATIGDSITRYNMVRPNNPSAGILDTFSNEDQGYITWANRVSGGAFYTQPEFCFGLGGDTTEPSASGPGINTRIPDVLTLINTGIVGGVMLMAGTNDLTNGIPASKTISNIQNIVSDLTAAGAFVVMLSITPRQTWGTLPATSVPQFQRSRLHINRTLKRWAETQLHVLYVDLEQETAQQGIFFGALTSGGASSVVLDAAFPNLATIDDAYKYMWLYSTNGANLGTPRLITSYTASTRTLGLLGPSWPNVSGVSLSFAATANTITRSDGGSWLDDGFVVGSAITISGSASNNGGGSVAGLTDTVLTTSKTIVSEVTTAATVGVTIPTSATTVAIDPRGAPLPTATIDGLHPSVNTAVLHGAKIKALVSPFVADRQNSSRNSSDLYHPTDNRSGNILVNGGFQGTGATVSAPFSGVLARGWSLTRTTTGGTPTQSIVGSKIARTDLIGAEWQRLAFSVYGGANEQYAIRQIIRPSRYSYSVGDVLEVDAVIQVSGISRVNEVTLQAYWSNDTAGTSQFIMDGRNQTFRGDTTKTGQFLPPILAQGVPLYYRTPRVVVGNYSGFASPQMTVQVLVNLDASGAVGSPATLTLDISQMALRKII